MAGGKSKVARLQETSAKKSRKRKPPKASSGLVEAWASEPSEEVESEPEVPDEVQDSPIPSQGDPASNSEEGESSQAPSEAPPVAAPQDANVLTFGLLKHMTNLVGILTTQLKPIEAAASGSTGAKVVKRLPIKILDRHISHHSPSPFANLTSMGLWTLIRNNPNDFTICGLMNDWLVPASTNMETCWSLI